MLRAEGLRVRLGRTDVLRGVDVAVEAGRVLGVLGPSGAGKSTLFRILAGELRPDAGRVTFAEEDMTRRPLWYRAARGLGYVPQTPSVLFELSVADNIRTFERAARVRTVAVEERAAPFDLGDRLGVRAGELSGGERRRLELLRALIAEPKVLVCDEPLTGIDPAAAGRIGKLLRERAERGMAILLADHRVGEALPICDEAMLLVDGRVEVIAAPIEFAEHPAVQRRYLA
jgi:lipopolysaccharide export system ATP-binding protein